MFFFFFFLHPGIVMLFKDSMSPYVEITKTTMGQSMAFRLRRETSSSSSSSFWL